MIAEAAPGVLPLPLPPPTRGGVRYRAAMLGKPSPSMGEGWVGVVSPRDG